MRIECRQLEQLMEVPSYGEVFAGVSWALRFHLASATGAGRGCLIVVEILISSFRPRQQRKLVIYLKHTGVLT